MFIDHFLSKNFHNLFNKNINDIERKILDKLKNTRIFFQKTLKELLTG